MKIVVTAQTDAPDAPVDPRFGRAAYFHVTDEDAGEDCVVSNEVQKNAAQGAGIQAGKRVVDLEADCLITGHVGPKAFSVLQAGGVEVYTGAQGTVQDALRDFRNGRLEQARTADVEGHWV